MHKIVGISSSVRNSSFKPGHPESWGSARGHKLLLELKKREMILLVAVDEFHQGRVSSRI